MILGNKSRELLKIITENNEDGSLLDTDQIINTLSWETKKPPLLDIIRSLIKKGLIERCNLEYRRESHRRCYQATELGIKINEMV